MDVHHPETKCSSDFFKIDNRLYGFMFSFA